MIRRFLAGLVPWRTKEETPVGAIMARGGEIIFVGQPTVYGEVKSHDPMSLIEVSLKQNLDRRMKGRAYAKSCDDLFSYGMLLHSKSNDNVRSFLRIKRMATRNSGRRTSSLRVIHTMKVLGLWQNP